MRIEIAGCSGFCFGVKRAISVAKQALSATKIGGSASGGDKNKGRGVYSLGHIIHNSQVVEELSKEGLRSIKDLNGIKEGIIVISSHGASPEIFEQIKTNGLEVVDATCPYVMSAQKIVKSLSKEDYAVVILGDKRHPEVKSLVGFAKGKAIVIKDAKELRDIEIPSKKIGLISQTTQSTENYFKIICEILKKEFLEFRVFNTICNDTKKRQETAARLAKDADAMIIVGGRMSANTKRLFEICSGICKDTYYIETEDELKPNWFKRHKCVGIASGASTPDWIIDSVKDEIARLNNTTKPQNTTKAQK